MRSAMLGLVGILVTSTLPAPGTSLAAEPVGTTAQRHLAETVGGDPNDFDLVYETAGEAPDGVATWAGKLVDRRTGEIHPVYELAGGSVGGAAALDEAVATIEATKAPMERKADVPLRAAVAAAAVDEPAKTLPVAVWLDVDASPAEAAVRDAHPEVTWLGTRPVVESLDQARALRGELWHARQAVYAAGAEALRADVETAGGSIEYVSTSSPLVFVDLPPGAVESVAALPEVRSLGLESEWRTSMSSAGQAVSADWTSG
ncbi:MAG: hypothetical protein ACRDFY_01005, partial [Candidatus Limnocylindria bacterium]